MNCFNRLYLPCRLVITGANRLVNPSVTFIQSSTHRSFLFPCIETLQVRTMAQKSIMSFFKITPKKDAEIKKEKPENDTSLEDAEMIEPSPVQNGKAKRSSKRQRLESSSSESQSPEKESPPTSVTKKVKRQRIESSESESEPTKSPEKSPEKSPKKSPEKSPAKSTEASPVPSPVKEIKIEKTENVKTYQSPKSKKAKGKKETKNENIAKKAIKEEKSPLPKTKSVKVEKSPLKENGKDKTPEKKKEVKDVKKEVKKEKEGELVPETEYDPTKSKYHPIKDACWAPKQPVPYLALAKTLEAIEAISARLKIIEILSNYFRSVIVLTPEDLLPSVYLCLNQIAPAYHSLELGIAETYLMKAIGQCTGRTLAQMKAAAQKTGDLGAVAEQARSTQRTMFTPPPLKARAVFNALKEIAGMTGQASVTKKIGKIQSLYVACRFSESRYLIRSLEGKLRIGLAEQSVLQALAQAAATSPPGSDVLDASQGLSTAEFKAIVDEQALIIKTTYCECPNYEMIIPVLLEHGVKALPHHCRLTPGIPLKPMLAHPTKGVHEVLNRFEGTRFTCEYKYDGERAQIHVPKTETEGKEVADLAKASIFSRNQENNTTKYPDILQRLPSLLKAEVSSCVLDCEAVAYDTVNKQILPFQILSTRKRKDASAADIKVQVCVFVFDLLYLNGRALVREPLEERRKLLRENFNEVEGEWQFATAKDCSSMDEVQQFLDDAVKGSCEGLMVKTLEGEHARYDIARRSHNWLKLKKDYLEGVGDTIDVVVIGGYHGRGKRRGVYGGFLLACHDAASEEYQALCKIGTGFSDEDLQSLTEKLQEHVVDAPRNYYRYDTSHAADVWFAPACVWEIRCADLSLSPAHRAAMGLVDPERGVSLRFPRFIRVRDDKTPEQATSAQQIAQMYLSQDQVKNSTSKPVNFDDFY
ncbi:DNA ligase 1 isoform X2 [Leguminivora glycinivorella]|uniref:DNA ligase 1 isoform X2 n=1 Tax=Leguminivora glycinivorella TaxID=1035111 RepID=UPI00200FA12B|nr:DNA ligase 1 isoform X2 [Leguminivora glycinivorella]